MNQSLFLLPFGKFREIPGIDFQNAKGLENLADMNLRNSLTITILRI